MKTLEDKARYFKALGDPVRLKMLSYLMDNPACTCICHLSKSLNKDQSVIFRHLQILKDSGIIETTKESKFLVCGIKDKGRLRDLLG